MQSTIFLIYFFRILERNSLGFLTILASFLQVSMYFFS